MNRCPAGCTCRAGGIPYPERFAAVGIGSAPINMDGYPYNRLKGVGLIVVSGDHDEANSHEAPKIGAQQAKDRDVDVEWLPVKQGAPRPKEAEPEGPASK